MKNTKNQFVATILTILLTTSLTVLILPNTKTTTVRASIPSDMLQYEWLNVGSDSSNSYFGDGPAPNAPNIKWKTKIPYVSANPVAFNGLVITQSAALGLVYALDADTGDIVWTLSIAQAGVLGTAITKIDDNYMLVGDSCVKTSDGTVVWSGASIGFSYGGILGGVGYIPELKMLITPSLGWSLADPSQLPTLVWNRTNENIYGDMNAMAYGEGKLICGTYHGFLICVDALTGETVWTTTTTGGVLYGGSYIDGKFVWGALDNNMHAWDIDTGELLWTYNPGTWYGMWASATGTAYGMVYEHNQDNHLYAIDADTGELVWKELGPGIGYSNTLVIGDGKVYCQMGENQYRDFNTGEYATSEYNCYDAYTGELIWTMPLENGAPFNLECIAYGNLYVVPNKPTPQEEGVWSYSLGGAMSLGEIWCISGEPTDWPMAFGGPDHPSEGAGPSNLALKWRTETDAPINAPSTLVDGICYFGSMEGTIYALDAETGTEIWTFKTDHWIMSSLAVVNDRVYTGTDDGNIYCLNAVTGAKIWETFAGGVIKNPTFGASSVVGADNARSSPIVVGGRVYVGALDGNLYCLDANSGDIVWNFQTGGAIQATPTIVDNAIYIPSSTPIPDGTVYKLNLDGDVIWEKSFPYVLDKTPGSGSYMFAPATVADGMVFIRNGLRLNYALNMTTGDTIWTYDGKFNPGTPFQLGGVTQYMPMLYKYGKLYFNDFYSITCLDATNGTEIWSSWMSRENLAQGISYSYQRIYTVTEFGVLYVLDALSGAKVSYYEFCPSRSQLHSMPIPYNGDLFVGSFCHSMCCFGDARLISEEPEPSISIASEQIWSNPTETTEAIFITTEVAINAAVAVVCVIGIISFWALRKRK